MIDERKKKLVVIRLNVFLKNVWGDVLNDEGFSQEYTAKVSCIYYVLNTFLIH